MRNPPTNVDGERSIYCLFSVLKLRSISGSAIQTVGRLVGRSTGLKCLRLLLKMTKSRPTNRLCLHFRPPAPGWKSYQDNKEVPEALSCWVL